MADLRVDAAGSRPRRGVARVPALGTRGGLLKQLGRAVLWLLVLVLLLRGVASVLEPRPVCHGRDVAQASGCDVA